MKSVYSPGSRPRGKLERLHLNPVPYFSTIRDHFFQKKDLQAFENVQKLRAPLLAEKHMELTTIIGSLKRFLKEQRISYIGIHGRTKGIYSTYRKLLKYDMDISRIYDLVAVRILVDSTDACYKVLSALHTSYTPLAGRMKDYILRPKSNGYRSIHSTVLSDEGAVFEIQIRTCHMHNVAEFGSAAHWIYDVAKERPLKSFPPHKEAIARSLQRSLRRKEWRAACPD